jgi:cysteine-rich repeat protein
MYTLTVHGEPATCGNGTVELGESCDDTNTTTGDGCSDTCAVEPGYGCTASSPSVCTLTCGNGVLDDGEDCDDANTTDGDGCSATCTVEPGYDCGFDEPSVCVKTCGNGAVDDGEECDGGPTGNDRCKADCTLIYNVAEVEPNDTTPQALDAIPHQVVKGTLEANDIDLYTFTLTSPATIEIETYDSSASIHTYNGVSTLTDLACYDDDNEIRIFDAAGNVTDNDTALIWDDQDGDGSCAYIGPSDSADDANTNDVADPTQGMLPAGAYTIKINDYFGDAETRYLFDLRIEPGGPVVAPHRAPPSSSIVKRLRAHPRKDQRREKTHR